MGKDTLAEMLAEYARKQGYKCYTISFADALKDAVSEFYDLPRDIYDTQAMKEQPIPQYPGWTYRKFLEVFGTDICRNINPHMWTYLAQKKIDVFHGSIGDSLGSYTTDVVRTLTIQKSTPMPRPVRVHTLGKLIQITDLRFKNEYEFLKVKRAVIIRVRRRLGPEDPHQVSTHVSNTVDETMVPDIDVDNNGTLEDLRAQIPTLFDLIHQMSV